MKNKKKLPFIFATDHGRSDSEKMVSGSVWMTAGSIASRLIGALYVIPWLYMIGSSKDGELANGLMSVGYQYYNIFLVIATAGLPAALSKQVAYYNERGEYRNSWVFFVRSSVLMVTLGVFFGVIMFLLAPYIAALSPKVNAVDSIRVIRSLVPAVMLIPMMSLIRGFIQGHHQMGPSALSQFYEQMARVAYMLLATYVIMIVMKGDYAHAVAHSTFAAFVGAVISLVYLSYLIFRERNYLMKRIEEDTSSIDPVNASYYLDMFKQAVPFVLFASGLELFRLVDTLSYSQLMHRYFELSNTSVLRMFGVLSFNVQKLVMIIISFATSIGMASLPLVSGAYARRDKEHLSTLVSDSLILLSFVMIPAAFGVFSVSSSLYNVFYSANDFGTNYLKISAGMSILFGAFLVMGYILQSLNLGRKMLIGLLAGLLFKTIWQALAISLLGSYGTALSTTIGLSLTVSLYLYWIHETVGLQIKKMMARLSLITAVSALMGVVAWLSHSVLVTIFNNERKLYALIVLLIVAVIGALIYGVLSLIVQTADDLIGRKAETLRTKLHLPTWSPKVK
ncbi:putative polysaccharide biosynthesis protein [Atopobacter phocae]|uniref:putative polysaccharide biosynthesis protein n=1 Tax=Atopobacter phocae TaxID=136492 RepID=UPI00047283C0|nr:polysaccharide biosynthesis protein [Atopobacter phocae]